jgi:hypothetical protein
VLDFKSRLASDNYSCVAFLTPSPKLLASNSKNIDDPSHVISQHRKSDFSFYFPKTLQQQITLIERSFHCSKRMLYPIFLKPTFSFPAKLANLALRRSTAPSYSPLNMYLPRLFLVHLLLTLQQAQNAVLNNLPSSPLPRPPRFQKGITFPAGQTYTSLAAS